MNALQVLRYLEQLLAEDVRRASNRLPVSRALREVENAIRWARKSDQGKFDKNGSPPSTERQKIIPAPHLTIPRG
jgi:hypothetical protein